MTRRPFRAPHHTVSAAGAGGRRHQSRGPARSPWPTTACCFWTSCRSSARTRWRRCASRWRTGMVTISRVAGHADLSQPVHAGVRHEPLPVRLVRPSLRAAARCSAQAGASSYLQPHLRPAAGPHRHARGGARRWSTRPCAARTEAGALRRHPRARVNAARAGPAAALCRARGVTCNAQMTPPMIGQYCRLDAAGRGADAGRLRAAGPDRPAAYDRILRVARTIADLEGAEQHPAPHIWRRPSSTAAAPC